MAEIIARAPRLADVAALVANLRPLDAQELTAASGEDLHNSVRRALHISPHRWAIEADGELVILGGVVPVSILGGVGSPWMLGTTTMDRLPGALTRVGMHYRDVAKSLFPELVNYVDARNVKAIRWLKRLGFTMSDTPVPYGVKGLPFYKFELRS